MTDRPAFRDFGKIAEKWLALAEKRRDDFAEFHRSGRWQRYYDPEGLIAQTLKVAEICDRWTMVLEQHRRALQALRRLEAPAINRDAA